MNRGQRRSTRVPSTVPGVILAAGKGTRMKGEAPKAAVRVGGRPMASRVAGAMRQAGICRIVAVVGHRAEDVRTAIGNGVEYVVQEEQLGTGHAARCAQAVLSGYQGPLVIAYADIPLLSRDDIAQLVSHHLETDAAATILTAVFEEPGTLGRILRDSSQRVVGIVEARDASPEQLRIREINVGAYCFRAPLLGEVLAELTNQNAQGQYYLTDAIGLLVRREERIEAVPMARADNGIGVDTQEDLARARRLWATGKAL